MSVGRAGRFVGDVCRPAPPSVPVAQPSWPLGDAIRAMETAGGERLAVCEDGRFVGVMTAAGLVQLDELLERTDLPR